MHPRTMAVALVSACLAFAPEARPSDFYPFYPTLLQWVPSKTPFTAPDVCGSCHERQYEEWSASMHALAWVDPVYQGELNRAAQAIGRDARNCEGCHSPAGVVTEEIRGAGLAGLSAVARAGVSCDVCHSISGVTHQQTPTRNPENGSLVLSPGRDWPTGSTPVKRGPFRPHSDCGGGFHECVQSPLHLEAELCASCHQSTHYRAHSPLGSTYQEWKGSPYAQRGIQCQDCHMVSDETFRRVADTLTRPSPEEYRHTFGGANFLLYGLAEASARKAGDDRLASRLRAQRESAVKRVQSCAEVDVSAVYRRGELAEVKVRVTNTRAGHGLPTHLTNIRQVWLEVTATDRSGAVLLASGRLSEEGELEPDTRLLGTEGRDEASQPAVDPWAVRSLPRVDSIPPKGFRDFHFGVPAPTGGGAVHVAARLRYRQAPPRLAKEILASVPADIDLKATYGLAGPPEIPIVDMASSERIFESRRPGAR